MGSPHIWKILFLLKIIFDIIGNGYDNNIYVAAIHYDSSYFFYILTKNLLPMVPLYVACFRYAFLNKVYGKKDLMMLAIILIIFMDVYLNHCHS